MGKALYSKGKVMEILYHLYIYNNYDIFNFKVNNSNKATYHHIIKVEELGSLGFSKIKTVENGIALSKIGHSYLHIIESLAPDIFLSINKIILLITKERRLPTYEERNLLQHYLCAFEYRMEGYYYIKPLYLTRNHKIPDPTYI